MNDVLRALALVAVAGLLWALNGRRSRRDRQWGVPLLVLVMTLVVLRYALPVPGAADVFDWLEGLGLALGPDARDLLARLWADVATHVDLLVLLVFVPVKLLGRALARLVPGRPAAPATAFYAEVGGAVALMPRWRYARTTLAPLALVGLALALANATPIADRLGLVAMPGGAALAFLLLSEAAFFLGGEETVRAAGPSEASADGAVAPTVDLDLVAQLTLERWQPWLLARGTTVRVEVPPRPGEVASPCAGLELEGWSDACCLLLDELLRGESVIVEDALPNEVAPCLALYLHDRLVRGGRILMLVARPEEVEPGRAFVAGLLAGHPWRILERDAALAEPPDVVVATPLDDLVRLLDESWAADLELVVVPDANALTWQAAEVRALLGAIADRQRRGRTPQVVAFADWRVNNEELLRNLLGVPGRNLQLGKHRARASYLVFGNDRAGHAFHEALTSRINAAPTPEVALAVPAVHEGARPRLLGLAEQPTLESLHELDNAARAGQLDARFPDTRLEGRADAPVADWLAPADHDETPVVIARDRLRNLPATLRRALPHTDRPALVEVVSPPYLLRRYFAATLERELAQPRRFTALAPGALSARWATAFELYRRLERGWVSLTGVRRALAAAGLDGTDGADTAETLVTLFARELDHPGVMLAWRRRQAFDAERADFVETADLRLAPGQRARRPGWADVVPVRALERRGGEPAVLDRVHRGHLYQRFLPGQVHAFAGRPYRIDRVDDAGVAVSATNTRERDGDTRLLLHAEVMWDARERVALLDAHPPAGRYRLTIERLRAPATVHTRGFLAWRPGAGAALSQAREIAASAPARHYPAGKLLEVHVIPAGGEPPVGVARTLAYLLSEMLWSYLPESRAFLRVLVSGAPGERADAVLTPTLGLPDRAGVILLEDSPFDLGLLAALTPNLDDILADLGEYLAWLESEGGDEPLLEGVEAGALASVARLVGTLETGGSSDDLGARGGWIE